MTTLAANVRKNAQYVETHIDAGHADPSDPKFDDFLTDLDTFVKNANRLRYQYHPPATIEERLSFLVLHADLLENLVTQAALDANAAVHTLQADIQAAADRTITAIGDVAALTAARDAALASQAAAEANAAASAQAATDAATAQAAAEAASAQAAADLVTANDALTAKQAELDAALAAAAEDAATNADTTVTAQAASATATGIAVTPV